MVFALRSYAEKLKILFDLLVALEQRSWHCLDFFITWHKPGVSGGTFRAVFCQICHMELLGSDYRDFPGFA